MESGSDWYRRWFGEEYVELYSHRDEAEARLAVRLLLRHVGRGASVLDLACGAGRHLQLLGEAGVSAVGLDLSAPLLQRARRAAPDATLVRGDMRALPFRAESFDAVTSFFTSFGYFRTSEEDLAVLGEVRRVLRAGGAYLLDFLNAAAVRSTLVPEDSRQVGAHRIHQRRRIEGDVVVKRIEIASSDDGPPRVFQERVRLYEPDRLRAMLAAARLPTGQAYGDYGGEAYGPESARLILTGRAR